MLKISCKNNHTLFDTPRKKSGKFFMVLQQSARYVPFIKNKRRVIKSLTFRWNDERVIEKCNDVNGDTIHENMQI